MAKISCSTISTCPTQVTLNNAPNASLFNTTQLTSADVIQTSGVPLQCASNQKQYTTNNPVGAAGVGIQNAPYIYAWPTVCASGSDEALSKLQNIGSVSFDTPAPASRPCGILTNQNGVSQTSTICSYTSSSVPGNQLFYYNSVPFYNW
jgi:hypothetical protein